MHFDLECFCKKNRNSSICFTLPKRRAAASPTETPIPTRELTLTHCLVSRASGSAAHSRTEAAGAAPEALELDVFVHLSSVKFRSVLISHGALRGSAAGMDGQGI